MTRLRQQLIRGFKWTSAYSLVSATTGTIYLFFIARLLVAEDFGIYALVRATVAFARIVAECGVPHAIIQSPDDDQNRLHSLFWFSLLMGCAMAITLGAASNRIAWLLGQDAVASLLKLNAWVLIVVPMNGIFESLLERDMRFSESTIARTAKLLTTQVVTVGCAFVGLGAMSFVLGDLIGTLVMFSSLVFIFIRGRLWLPKLRFSISAIRPYYSFGIFVAGKDFVNTMSMHVDDLVIGQVLGPEVLGIYYFAKRLVEKAILFPVSMYRPLTYPAFVKAGRSLQFRLGYLKGSRIVALFGFPLFMLIAVTAEFLIPLFFGEQWRPAVPFVWIFAGVGGFILLTKGFPANALYAHQRPGLVMGLDTVFMIIWIMAVITMAPQGALAVTFAVSMAQVIKFVVLQVAVAMNTGVQFAEYMKNTMLLPITFSVILGLLYMAITSLIPSTFGNILGCAACAICLILMLNTRGRDMIAALFLDKPARSA